MVMSKEVELGRAVSLSSDGHILAMGAPYDFEDNVIDPPGMVRIVSWNGKEWLPLGLGFAGSAQFSRKGSRRRVWQCCIALE